MTAQLTVRLYPWHPPGDVVAASALEQLVMDVRRSTDRDFPALRAGKVATWVVYDEMIPIAYPDDDDADSLRPKDVTIWLCKVMMKQAGGNRSATHPHVVLGAWDGDASPEQSQAWATWVSREVKPFAPAVKRTMIAMAKRALLSLTGSP